jgi:predicted ATP-binding protein involved in virulence
VRIDRLTIKNFNGFESSEFNFDPHFNLLVGDNATGKTSVLDALSIAVDSWFLGMKGSEKAGGIDPDQVRVVAYPHLDGFSFEKQFPARIEAEGVVMGRKLAWARELSHLQGRTTTAEAKGLVGVASETDQMVRDGEKIPLPLICSYGTERLWYESRHSKRGKKEELNPQLPSRLDGYRDCNVFEIQETALLDWIRAEVSVGQQRKEETSAWRVMQRAIIECVEGAKSLYWDERYKDLIVSMDHLGQQMFRNLSDGQRIMLTLVGDLVKRATTLNPDLGDEVLQQIVGIVIIDELDLHLHPKWQRRVIHDLKRIFPRVQFITTTHSPQLIGEALPSEIRILAQGKATTPPRSFGIDSSRILTEVMHASPRNADVEALLSQLSKLIDQEDLENAKQVVDQVQVKLGQDDPEVTGANTLIDLLESTR